MKRPCCAFCWLLVSLAAQAEAGDPKPAPVELVAHFIDGSVLRRVRLTDSIDVQTRYGKLTVPVQDIRRIEFASRVADETAKQIERAIEQLGNRVFAQREAASRDLTILGAHAYPALKKAAASTDKEVSKRAQEIVTVIEQTVSAEQLRSRPNDAIHTSDSVLTGQILAPSLKAKTNTFGDTQLAIAELRVLHLETQARSLTLEGKSFPGMEGRWLDTGVMLDAGTDVRIQASGEMDLCSKSQPGQHRCGPDGNGNFGRYADNTLPGMLMARIGEQGTPFAVGSQNQIKSISGSGKLYLSVVSVATAGEQMMGHYQVRVTTGLGITMGPIQPGAPAPPTNLPPVTTGAAAPVPVPLPEPPAAPAGPAAGVPLPRASY